MMTTQTQIHQYVETTHKKLQEGKFKRKYSKNQLRINVRLKPQQYEKIIQSGLTISDYIRQALDAY